jgi:hypothetical protein
MTHESQCSAILQHMRTKGSISPLLALKLYGCFRLAARINDLKRGGWFINSTLCERNGKRYASYSLIGKKRAAA